jgi:hypothetical protein
VHSTFFDDEGNRALTWGFVPCEDLERVALMLPHDPQRALAELQRIIDAMIGANIPLKNIPAIKARMAT